MVVITDTNLGDGSEERGVLGEAYEVAVFDVTAEDDVVAAAGDAQGLLVQWARITDGVLGRLPQLRAIVRYGIGIDNIDVEAAHRRGIAVSNVPDYCVDEVADHAAASIYAHQRRLTVAGRSVASGDWNAGVVDAPHPPGEDPVGIAGYGRIGRLTGQRLAALGFPIHVWDPYIDEVPDGVTRHRTLLDLASVANHLSLHMPSTDDTAGLVDRQILAALGPAGHLVNTARGGLINEPELLTALTDGHLGFASLDVLSSEPPTGIAAEIAAHPRALVTPHLAYLSTRSLPQLKIRAAEILRDLLKSSG